MKTVPLSVAFVLSLAVGIGAFPAHLQAQAPSTPTQNQTQAPTPPPPQKKVWTNDDIEQIRNQGAGGISVMGPDATSTQKSTATAPAAPAKPGAKAPALPKEKDPEWYRQQLAPLYTALDRIHDEMTAAQSAVSGDSRGDSGVSMGARAPAGTPQEQVIALQKEEQDTQAKIDALLDMARRNDIPPGDLR
ncbi:MAG: hypothetical protein WA871_05070 [Candidatus Acidiferrales bacterium]